MWDQEMENILVYSTFTADGNESVVLGYRRREIYQNEVLG